MVQGVSAIPNEKHRLYWDNLPIWYKMREHATKLASYGACIVAGSYFYNWLLPFEDIESSQPLDSLASSLALSYINRGLEFRIDFLRKVAKEYSLDGLIMQSTRSCKPFYMGQYDIVEAIERETGIPGVVVEGDMCDSRLYSDAQFNSRIETFMEILASRAKKRMTD